MKVLHLSDRLSVRGGAHLQLLALLREQVRVHEPLLAVGARDPDAVAPCPVHVVAGLGSRTGKACDLDALVRALRPDVLHMHTIVNPWVLEWAAARPALISVQDHRYFCPARGKWTLGGAVCREPLAAAVCAACFDDQAYFRDVLALTERRLAALRRLHALTLSEYMRAELRAAGVPAERVSVVPPFADGLDAGAEPDGPPCVLFAGRLVEAKGVRDAVLAWRASGLQLPLVFAGTGPLRADLEREGHEVLGWLSRARLSAAYGRARVLLMPSRWQEPFGIAGLEALSLGVPVAAWDSGGVREWHPGGPGLVAWGDVAGLGRALAALCGRSAEPVRGFERETSIARLEACYASACA